MPSPPIAPLRGAEWTMLLALSVLWGGTFFFAEIALAAIPPLTLVLGRVAIAALALHAILRLARIPWPRDARLWLAFLAMGTLNNLLPFALIFWGQTRIEGGLAAILNATTPLWTVIIAHAATRDERLSPAKLAGVGLGLAGIAVLIGPAALGGLGGEAWAQLAVVSAAAIYGAAAIFGRRFRDLPPALTAAGQLTGAALATLPVALIVDRPWTLARPPAGAWAALAALALASTALAYILYFRILAVAGATNLLLVTFLIPVSALALGIGFLGERLTLQSAGGLVLIGLGLAGIDGRPLRRLSRRASPSRAA